MNNPDADVNLGSNTAFLGSEFAMPSSNGYKTSVTFGIRFHSLYLIQRLNVNHSSYIWNHHHSFRSISLGESCSKQFVIVK